MWNKTNSALALGELYFHPHKTMSHSTNKQHIFFLIISIAMIPKNVKKNAEKYKEEIIATRIITI